MHNANQDLTLVREPGVLPFFASWECCLAILGLDQRASNRRVDWWSGIIPQRSRGGDTP